MLWSLWINYILYAENSKQKQTRIFSVLKHLFSMF